MTLRDKLLAMTGFPARFEEQKDGSLVLDFVAAERKGMLSSRKVTYHCRVRVDEPGKNVLFYEILKEKGAGISSGDETGPGFGFKKETYKITGKERSGSITESSTFLGQGYVLSFDYGLIRETVKREAEAEGYAFSVTLRESSVSRYKGIASGSGGMASVDAAGARVKPSRWFYGLSFLLLVAGGIVFGVFLSNSIQGIAGSLQRMVMPRSYYVTLPEAGRYTIFHEYRSTVGGKMYAAQPNLRGMRAMLVARATGEQVRLFPPSATYSYSSGFAGVSVMQFDIAKPGVYQFSAWYDSGAGPEVVLAVGNRFQERISGTIMAGAAILLATLGLSAVLAVTVFLKRRKAKKVVAAMPIPEPLQAIEPQ